MSQNQRLKLSVITAIGLAILLPWFVLTHAQERKPKPIVGDSVGGHSSSNLKVGDQIPALRTADQFGKERDFDNLKGTNGLIILFFKSAEW
jgi:hypothetical protein